MIALSFLFFLLVFAAIGALSMLQKQNTTDDYLLAGQSTKPWLVALSAVATNNSGYMFIGMIGFTYTIGLASVWLALGWVLGDFIASFLVHKKLRITSEKQKCLSFAGVLSNWNGENFKKIRLIGGIITVLFLGIYAGAQLKAGSKALTVMFGWHDYVGALIGAAIVLLYCFSGGIRASIWTDAAQSFVMAIAMILLFVFGVTQVGGMANFISELKQVSPTYLSLYVDESKSLVKLILFILGWVFAGFGVAGQPHIMVRFMAVDDSENMKKARIYYYAWFLAFFLLTVGVGLVSKLLLTNNGVFDAELALPLLSLELLPSILVGLVLAGLFAATMSTADSQILSCSASLTSDIFTKAKSNYLITKLGTVLMVLISLIIALVGPDSVFVLVLIAWSFLSCAFVPLIVVYALNQKPSENLALLMMFVGVATMLVWKYFGLDEIIYEAAPGIIAGLLVYLFRWR
jgi:sodium/proline symporter